MTDRKLPTYNELYACNEKQAKEIVRLRKFSIENDELQGKVERLQAQLEAERWISVEERLPEQERLVWVTDGTNTEVGYLFNKTWKASANWRQCSGMSTVTHYKPITLPSIQENEK